MATEGSISGRNVVAGLQVQNGGTVNVNFAGSVSSNTIEPFNMTPFPIDSRFIKRPAISEWIDGMIAQGSRGAALVGLGGVG